MYQRWISQLLKQQATSDIDIDLFHGNRMNFNYFMAVFNEIVEKKVDDPKRKLTQLIKYTTDDAKETVKNCIKLPVEIGFETAKQWLTERYRALCEMFPNTEFLQVRI